MSIKTTEIEYIENDSDDSISNNESDVDVEVDKVTKILSKKIIKKKNNFLDILEQNYNISKERDILQDEIDNLMKLISKKNIIIKKKNISIKKNEKLLEKRYYKDIKLAGKEKRKSTKPNLGGFNRPNPIPNTLRKYIGITLLPDTVTELNLPGVYSLLTKAFKRDKLKNGKKTVIDKRNAWIKLGVKKGKVIEFDEYMPFIKSYY
tara:strand:+ start:3891 stop:4508 length:618 start_codon:yes stop_codon:yes gene_type:complete